MIYFLIFIFELFLLYLLSRKLKKHLLIIFMRIFKKEKIAVIVYSSIFFLGTFVHEMSHFLSAILLFVPIGKINLFPKVEKKKIELGFVEVSKTDIFRQSIIGIAPLIFGNIILFVIVNYFPDVSRIVKIIFAIALFQVANSMFLSLSDLKSFLILFCVVFLLLVIASFLGLSLNVVGGSRIDEILLHLETVVSYLIYPIIIDAVLLLPFLIFSSGQQKELH